MSTTQIIHWVLWGMSLFAGIGVILALFKLRIAEKSLPPWKELKELETVLPVLREELRQVGEATLGHRQELAKLEGTVGHLHQLHEWQKANPDAPVRIQQMMTDLERSKSELSAVQQKLAQEEARLNEVLQQVSRLTQEKIQLTEQVPMLRDQLVAFGKQKVDLEKTLRDLEDQQHQAKDKYEKTLRDLDDQQHQAEQKLNSVKSELQTNETNLTGLRQNVKLLEQEKAAVQRERDQVRVDRDAAKLELAVLQKSFESLTSTVAGLEKQKSDLEKLLRDYDDRRRQSELALNSVKAELQANESRLAKLQNEVGLAKQEKATVQHERDQARADRDSAKAELEGLKKALETYKALVENLNVQLERTSAGHSDPVKALEDLAQPVLKFAFTKRTQLSESLALRKFSEHLTQKGLLFTERVQLAFHTSLKAAHINPLVVLAGVSGTGKSALPMAYAEAMGINFLSLAVQPGWSGPQDLLGFYNYLERKYKATELARALAQMSRFSSEDLPKLNIESRKDQMMLLLLDEMNLARIEYYFSDFLSRLEQRRGRNVEDAQRRREVSLLIDAGSLPMSEAPRFIFPDYNVLFVGTMNEDESTQSLSDKVIDRANVLRFGAPKDLQAAHSNTVAPSTEYLPSEKWQEWVKSFDGTGFEEERQTLIKINRALESVNRPFGHRVYRAILDYLTNYPDARQEAGVGVRRRHALADQIEQKVIPKLRGLDTQDDNAARCLDQLSKVVADLQDSELAESFNYARQQHLFEWHGVKRS